ncbi:hypothetical protein INR49_013602, partial [Caranx melampygus]
MRKAAVLPENKARNRFNNVLPYDWCRVKLSTSNPNETSDYINASYMPGYNRQREYIATQGPLPSTVCDFWRMIWEQRVKGIVMVTNCVEGGRTKCERYWPPDSNPCPHGKLLITMKSEQQEPNWTLREFSVKNTSTSEERTVKHFHFTAWPDHGVPEGTDVLIQFRELVRWHIDKEGDGAPTVVHCSAGVGRTGTIIALDVLLQQFDKKRAVGINGFVHKMRLSRPYMVQTESQYVFLHQCIMDHLKPQEKLEENIYENADIIYANATALQEVLTKDLNVLFSYGEALILKWAGARMPSTRGIPQISSILAATLALQSWGDSLQHGGGGDAVRVIVERHHDHGVCGQLGFVLDDRLHADAYGI